MKIGKYDICHEPEITFPNSEKRAERWSATFFDRNMGTFLGRNGFQTEAEAIKYAEKMEASSVKS